MKSIAHIQCVVLVGLGLIVLLLPEVTMAQRSTVLSAQSQQNKMTFPTLSASFSTAPQVDEIEPNNALEDAQTINEALPAIVNGMVEVADEGDPMLNVLFNDNSVDDLEDLFFIRIAEPGLSLELSGFDPADCDLYVFGPDEDGFLDPDPVGVSLLDSPEIITLPDLPAGPYIIAVAIYDPMPGAESASYTLTISEATSTANEATDVPTQFDLSPNYPNPFNPETRIQYKVPTNTPVRLEVFNLLGRKVRTLVNESQSAGAYSVVWDGLTDAGAVVSSGVYVYRMQAGSFSQARTMVLMQ